MTRVAYARATRVKRVFLVIYMQVHAMQITFVYRPTRVFTTCLHAKVFLHTHAYACARVSTVNGQENLKPTIKYNAFIHVYLLLLEYTIV